MVALLSWAAAPIFAIPITCGAFLTLDLGVRSLSTNSSPILFHHRSYQNSIVVGDYLYIDGGEFTTWNGSGPGYEGFPGLAGDRSAGNMTDQREENTLSIDLTSSWTNGTVTLKKIPKVAPVLNSEALWLSGSNRTFYAYDGGISWAGLFVNATPENALWEFNPSGNSGSWAEVSNSPTSIFAGLSRVSNALYASGNGLAFAVGGIENGATEATEFALYSQWTDVPGMVVYNTTNEEWYNISIKDMSFAGTISQGAAHFVPSYGPAGLLFTFGGTVENYQIGPDVTVAPQFFPFDSVNIYEPIARQWLSQKTSGSKPANVVNPCVVGTEGDDGTYEIFLYGGWAENNVPNTVDMGVVYVLSLPSFHWEKQDYTPAFGRYRHSCNLVGNRQMVTIGGNVILPESTTFGDAQFGAMAPDPWAQGIGIFDLTEMAWKASYDANAAPYITPQSVKTYIADNGRFPSAWTDPRVKTLFAIPGSSNSSTTSSSHSSSPSAGAIAGGVIGGMVAVGLVVAGVILSQRKRRRRQPDQVHQKNSAEYRKPELEATNGLVETDGASNSRQHFMELQGTHSVNELQGSRAVNELQGSRTSVELPTENGPSYGRIHEMGS